MTYYLVMKLVAVFYYLISLGNHSAAVELAKGFNLLLLENSCKWTHTNESSF